MIMEKKGRVTEEMQAKAEVWHGDHKCREKLTSLLSEIGLPAGLLASQHLIEECGYVEEVGFVWLRLQLHDKPTTRYRINNVVLQLDSLVTAYLEPKRIKNLTGVRAREFLLRISLSEISVVHQDCDSNASSIITFKTSAAGLSKSFPISLFQPNKQL